MVNIYCLINPINQFPFYVGSTITPLNKRLSVHISNAQWHGVKRRKNKDNFVYAQQKDQLILELQKMGQRPQIKLLAVVEYAQVDYYENLYYTILTTQGYNLLQASNKFYYQRQNNKWQKKI